MGALDEQRWLDVRRFRALHEAGASVSEIARETGLNWRTVKKYLGGDTSEAPPRRKVRPSRGQVIDAFAHVVDAWLRAELLLKGTVIHERLVEQYGFTGDYQRVKLYLQQARPRIAAELGISPDQLAGLHRRFEVVPGAQAQVDWGDEGGILAHVGIPKVYSFHMVLSYSRDPFCCFTTSQDLAAFWGAHRRAFAHFGGVPGSVVYDRTKTVVRRHVAPGQAVPLHPEAVAFTGQVHAPTGAPGPALTLERNPWSIRSYQPSTGSSNAAAWPPATTRPAPHSRPPSPSPPCCHGYDPLTER